MREGSAALQLRREDLTSSLRYHATNCCQEKMIFNMRTGRSERSRQQTVASNTFPNMFIYHDGTILSKTVCNFLLPWSQIVVYADGGADSP